MCCIKSYSSVAKIKIPTLVFKTINSETQLLTNLDSKFLHKFFVTLPTDRTFNVHHSKSLSKLNDTDSAIMIRAVEAEFGPRRNFFVSGLPVTVDRLKTFTLNQKDRLSAAE